MQRKKPKFKIDNCLDAYGEEDDKTGIIKVNVKKHKGDKQELANTIKHELMHNRHPKMKEKTVYKKLKGQIHSKEASKLLKKLHTKYSA